MTTASSRHFIPRPDAAYNTFFENLVTYVSGWYVTWGIPQTEFQALRVVLQTWRNAYTPTLEPHTPQITREKDRVRVETERALRAFINRFLRWPPVTDFDRDNMGVPNHDLIRTEHTVVTEKVALTIGPGAIREVVIHFWIDGADHRAKPEGYDGAVLIWAVGDFPFVRIEDLRDGNLMASRTPHTLTFTDDQRGKTVTVSLAWQNERGTRGEWSEILSTVIP